MSHFCLIKDPQTYEAHDWDLLSDETARIYWLNHFADHFAQTLNHASKQYGRAAAKQIEAARAEFADAIQTLRNRPDSLPEGKLDIVRLCRLRERVLRSHGLNDPFRHIKERENASAVHLYPQVVRKLHALEGRDKWLHLIECVFAGNIFDLGSAATMHFAAEGADFIAAAENTKPRPWFVDHFDILADDLPDSPPTRWARAVVFIDNAGTDFILGIMPLARELALYGTQIVLAANEQASLNDMTVTETIEVVEQLAAADPDLAALVRGDMFEVVSSGNDIPLIDLSEVSDELNEAAADADLLILEGMGRGVESNFDASFKVDTIWLAMLKDEQVAARLGAELYDCVCKYAPLED